MKLIERLRQHLVMSMFSTTAHLYAEQETQRREAAYRIEELEARLHELALDWQVQQTKIAAKDALIATMREFILDHVEVGPNNEQMMAQYDSLTKSVECAALREHDAAKDALIAKLRELVFALPEKLAKFNFGSKDQEGTVSLSAAFLAVAHSLSAKDGLDISIPFSDDTALREMITKEREDAYDSGFLVGTAKGRNISYEIQEARKAALMEAADKFWYSEENSSIEMGVKRWLRRMAEEQGAAKP